jgi:hypothetical protein
MDFSATFRMIAHFISIFKKNIPLYLILSIAGVIVFNNCANQGMPTGGLKDSIPPLLIETSPAMMSRNFDGKEVRLTFNEYVISDAVSEELVVSPPLSKRPNIRTKSKTLIVSFNEALKPASTYSLDFKNAVVDNNENNPYLGLRMLFSTGSEIDTLRVAGLVKDAEKLELKDKTLVMLYSNLHDTAVYRSNPDYIARTNQRGLYLFDNVKKGKYHLFALNDANNNYHYDKGAEEFAFADSLVIPTAEYQSDPDTLAIGADSLLIFGHTLFKPDPVYLRTFTEKSFEQYLDKSIRESRHKFTLVFAESVKDTLDISLFDRTKTGWYILENNPQMDSLTVWVTDSLIAKMDTIKLVVSFNQLDSLQHKFLEKDTLHLIFTEKERPEMRRKKKDEEVPEVLQFSFLDNIKQLGFDLNIPILLESPEPVKYFDFSRIKLYKTDDSTKTSLKIKIQKDTTQWRSYRIDYHWEPGTDYMLEIDSTACGNIYGVTSQKVKKQFVTQKEDYYGKIILNLSSVETPLLIQLLDNSKDEKVLKTLAADKNGKTTFDFLSPGKYKIKIIFDTNNNHKWDEGDFIRKIQPERVAYLPEIVKVRSNWDNNYEWDLHPDPTYKKELIDKEEEELRLKKLKEQQRMQNKQEAESPEMNPERQIGLPGRN